MKFAHELADSIEDEIKSSFRKTSNWKIKPTKNNRRPQIVTHTDSKSEKIMRKLINKTLTDPIISRIKNNINDQILKYMKESSVDCSLYASSDNLVCFNYGKVKSNQFGSVPSISEDKFQKDETHAKTRKFQKFYEDDVEYVLDKKTNEVFTIESYNRLMKNPRARFNPIGILEKKGRKYGPVQKGAKWISVRFLSTEID